MDTGPDDDVVQHFHVHHRQSRLQRASERAVSRRGAHIATGVVVREDDRRRALVERELDHFARVDRGLVKGAFEHFLETQ